MATTDYKNVTENEERTQKENEGEQLWNIKTDGKAWSLDDLRIAEMHKKEEEEEQVDEKEVGKEGKSEARAE
jgi:hypothetical protein